MSLAILSRLAVVKEVDNISKPFEFVEGSGARRFGEKCCLCNVSSSTVVFLDADVIVRKDLTHLLEGDFDFSARKHFPTRKSTIGCIDEGKWSEIFRSMSKEPIPMPNAGLMIFKNFCHHSIKEEWLRHVNDPYLPNACRSDYNPKEQTAIALALSGKKIRWLTANEHAYSWLGEVNTDTYVIHKKPIMPKSLIMTEVVLWNFAGRSIRVLSRILFP